MEIHGQKKLKKGVFEMTATTVTENLLSKAQADGLTPFSLEEGNTSQAVTQVRLRSPGRLCGCWRIRCINTRTMAIISICSAAVGLFLCGCGWIPSKNDDNWNNWGSNTITLLGLVIFIGAVVNFKLNGVDLSDVYPSCGKIQAVFRCKNCG